MKPVDQTTFGNPGGNCFSACVASLLELPIADVPYFMGSDRWFDTLRDWLEPRGFDAVFFKASPETWAPRGLCILGGQSPRGSHACVGRGIAVVHDPHPSRDGLKEIEDMTLIFPIDPGAPRRTQ